MISFIKKNGDLILPHLNHILKTYYFSTNIPVIVLDERGNSILSQGEHYIQKTDYNINTKEIDIFIKNKLKINFKNKKDTFLYNHLEKLTYIIAPYFHNGSYKGSILAGPILINEKKDILIETILRKQNLPISSRKIITRIIKETPEKLPPKNFFLGQLLHHLMEKGILIGLQHIDALEMKDTFIGKNFNIDDLKKLNNSYDIAVIKQLTKSVTCGNIALSIQIYDKGFNIQDYKYIKGINSLKFTKYNLVSLCINLVNEIIITNEILGKDISNVKNENIANIDNQDSIENLLLSGKYMVKTLVSFVNKHSLKNKSKYIQSAVNYIDSNYSNNITLDEVANHIHLSGSYLSTLFKKEMNESFKTYLNKVRVRYSKSLLVTTNNSILDIALSVGFDNQNYFSTVFKKFTNMTPKNYIKNYKSKMLFF